MLFAVFCGSTWSQFIDEMKTLEYKNVALLQNPIADASTDANGGNQCVAVFSIDFLNHGRKR